MKKTLASGTSSGIRGKTASSVDRGAGSTVDELQQPVVTDGVSGVGQPHNMATAKKVFLNNETVALLPRFLLIKRIDGNNFATVSPFVISKAVYGLLGNVKELKKTKEGLLVECVSNAQTKRLLSVTQLAGYAVEVSPHSTLNFSKGVITCKDLLNSSIEEIKEELQSEGVIDAKRITSKVNGELSETASLIITFNVPYLPKTIKAAMYRLQVRPYIPSPMRCFKCQKFGHTSIKCTSEQICVCGKPIHEGRSCTKPVTCVNCGGEHPARSKDCPKYKEELEIQRIKVTEKISYFDAKKKVIPPSTPSTTYAKAVQGNPETIQKLIKEMTPYLIEEIKKQIESKSPNLSPPTSQQINASTEVPSCSTVNTETTQETFARPTLKKDTASLNTTNTTSSKRKDKETSSTQEDSDSSVLSSAEGENPRKKPRSGRPKGRTKDYSSQPSESTMDTRSKSQC